ncbi:MAG: aminoacyl-tRNA hydrolase [Pirellulales bacterium]|nr:aminoacyl-tRNA hydrolase [Pirellulales bacterium]
MKLVVGLGNPGRKYEATRHNVGFAVVGLLARRCGAGPPRAAFRGEVAEVRLDGERVLLLCPHTYMNRSGLSVLAARDYYKLENQDLLVVCDDFNLPLGRLRARARGSAGGQRGLADIIRVLGTEEFCRLRVGIGQPPAGWDPAAYVLSHFSEEERVEIDAAVERAADAVEVWVTRGIDECMNRFNS